LILFERVIEFRLLYAKASSPILVTESGIIIDSSLKQYENEDLPIFITESAISTDSSLEQDEKALSPIFVTPSLIIILFMLSLFYPTVLLYY